MNQRSGRKSFLGNYLQVTKGLFTSVRKAVYLRC